MLNSVTVGSGILCDGLYKTSLNHEFAQALITLHSNVGLMKILQSCGIED